MALEVWEIQLEGADESLELSAALLHVTAHNFPSCSTQIH